MALDVGLQHAVIGSRSQSGFPTPSLLKGAMSGRNAPSHPKDRPTRWDRASPHQQSAPDVRAPRRWQPLPRCPRGL
jgi:hypothetical protein